MLYVSFLLRLSIKKWNIIECWLHFIIAWIFKHKTIEEIGNAVFDCGTTANFLPNEFYTLFEAQVEAELDLLYTRNPDPLQVYNLCYEQDSIEKMGDPTIILNLRGRDLVLSAENTYIMVAME